MCGRYALALPPWRVRQLLQDANMPSDNAPDDDDARQSYNFAPGYYGLVYRQDGPDHGAAGGSSQPQQSLENPAESEEIPESQAVEDIDLGPAGTDANNSSPRYKIQAMAWGLTPFWTKRRPDYATILRTINCRDDSLARSGGMWHTMKQKKRCIVLAQGFFEWLKKNEGKDKIPHYIKRKDGQLMCFAGLWDSVAYEDKPDKHYSYTIITTDSNKQISFLHDRMPVIFDNGSEEMFTWLDSTNRSEWSQELQSLLKPYKGELEIYPVTKDMNKTGSSSPNFIVPIDDSKQSISHFFGKKVQEDSPSKTKDSPKSDAEGELHRDEPIGSPPSKVHDAQVSDDVNEESNAPIPATPAVKRSHDEIIKSEPLPSESEPKAKAPKQTPKQSSAPKSMTPISSKRSKSATSNATVSKESPVKNNQKITSFFKK